MNFSIIEKYCPTLSILQHDEIKISKCKLIKNPYIELDNLHISAFTAIYWICFNEFVGLYINFKNIGFFR